MEQISLLYGSQKQGEVTPVTYLAFAQAQVSINQSIRFLEVRSSLFVDALIWTGAAQRMFAYALFALWQHSITLAVVCTAVMRLRFDDVLFHA